MQSVRIVGQLPPPVHGTTIMAQELAACLGRIEVPHRVIEKRLSTRIEDVGRLRPAKLFRAVQFLREVSREARAGETNRPTFVVFLSCTAASFLTEAIAIRVIKRSACRLVLYLHGIGFRSLASRSRLLRRAVASVFRVADAVVVLGAVSAQDVAEWVQPDKIVTIPNTLPAEEGESDSSLSGPRGDRPRCLFLSTLDPAKGAREFILAAAHVGSAGVRAEFRLAGQASNPGIRSELEALIHSERLESSVSLVGPAYGPDKERLLAQSDVFVFPSSYRLENQPLVILEAMRAGLPIIATRIGNIPTQVEHNGNGYLLDGPDPAGIARRVIELCADSDLQRRMGQRSRDKFAAGFSPSVFDRNWRALLERLAQAVDA